MWCTPHAQQPNHQHLRSSSTNGETPSAMWCTRLRKPTAAHVLSKTTRPSSGACSSTLFHSVSTTQLGCVHHQHHMFVTAVLMCCLVSAGLKAARVPLTL